MLLRRVTVNKILFIVAYMRWTSNVDHIHFRVCSEQYLMQLVLFSTLLSVAFSFFHLYSSIFILNLVSSLSKLASSVMGGEQLCFSGVWWFPVNSTESAGLVQQEPAIRFVCIESWTASVFEIFCYKFGHVILLINIRQFQSQSWWSWEDGWAVMRPFSFSGWNTKSLFKSQYVAMVN